MSTNQKLRNFFIRFVAHWSIEERNMKSHFHSLTHSCTRSQQLQVGDVIYCKVTAVQRARVNPGCFVRLLCTHMPKNIQFVDLNVKVQPANCLFPPAPCNYSYHQHFCRLFCQAQHSCRLLITRAIHVRTKSMTFCAVKLSKLVEVVIKWFLEWKVNSINRHRVWISLHLDWFRLNHCQ